MSRQCYIKTTVNTTDYVPTASTGVEGLVATLNRDWMTRFPYLSTGTTSVPAFSGIHRFSGSNAPVAVKGFIFEANQ